MGQSKHDTTEDLLVAGQSFVKLDKAGPLVVALFTVLQEWCVVNQPMLVAILDH